MSLRYYSLVCFLLFLATTAARERKRRELPLSRNCDPRVAGSCYKGDLIAKNVASCKRQVQNLLNCHTCDPINDLALSSVVDLPDVAKHGVNCVPKVGLPIVCGAQGTNTRCVCDKAVDWRRPHITLINQCRCQYWPAVDVRSNWPSYCTQYDHGGTSNVHFYICCNNCNDANNPCDGHTYDGGGSDNEYCGRCGAPRGGGRITYRFNCVSCAQQDHCERTCNRNIASRETPGLCPKWAGCFRRCCIAAQNRAWRNGRDTEETDEINEFCGDFICQEGENHNSCPFDCCASHNPSDCSPCNVTNNTTNTSCATCPPGCCEESHCCVPDDIPSVEPLPSQCPLSTTSLTPTPTPLPLPQTTPTSSPTSSPTTIPMYSYK